MGIGWCGKGSDMNGEKMLDQTQKYYYYGLRPSKGHNNTER
jgi:hypothetical protein